MLRRLLGSPWAAWPVLLLLFPLLFSRWLPNQSLEVLQSDSGMFLYVGQQINRGAALYSDVWDFKPPLIYYLNAASLRLGWGSPRGVVIAGCVSLTAFCALIWAILRPRWGPRAAFFALLLLLNLLPDLALQPNSTELFSLPFQAVAFWLIVRESEGVRSIWHPIGAGLATSVLFLLRPNNAAVGALYLAAAWHRRRDRSRPSTPAIAEAFAASFAIGSLALLSPIIRRGDVHLFWDAVFRFGARYSSARSILMRPYAVGVGVLKTARFGGILITAAAGGALMRKRRAFSPAERPAALALALLALEVCASSVSGMAFEHYYLMWLLPVVVLAGFSVWMCQAWLPVTGGKRAFAAACGLLALASAFDSARTLGKAKAEFRDDQAGVVQFVRDRALPGDRLFVWGGAGDLAFRIGLKPGSRFFSGAPMANSSRAYREQAPVALGEVLQRDVRFILEVPNDDSTIPSLFPSSRDNRSETASWDTGDLKALKDLVRRRYSLRYVSSTGIRAYELTSTAAEGRSD